MRRKQNFTEGRIFGPLVRFALPVLLAMFLQTLYGAVDLLVVGQFGGKLAGVYVSAVSTGSEIMRTITIVVSGLAMGLTVLVGDRIGAGRREEVGEIVGSGIWLFGAVSLGLTVAMLLMAPQLSRLMQAPEEAFDATVTYVWICGAGSIFIVFYNLLGSVFRGIGDSQTPLMTVALACVLNIIGDLLLVAGLQMGAAGAAIATVFAQAASVLLSLLIIRRKGLPFAFSRADIRPHGRHIRKTLRLGVPIALQDLLVSVSFLAIIAIANGLGLTASAGVGVAEKLCGFLMLLPGAYMQSMSAFVAQNIGAGKPDRAVRALWHSVASSLCVGLVIGYFTSFHGDALAGLFAQDAGVVSAADYLRAYGIDCVLTPFLFCFIGYFNGCGDTTFVMLQGIVGGIGVRLPLAWLMSKVVPVSLFRIGLATPMSTVVQIALCFGSFARSRPRSRLRETG